MRMQAVEEVDHQAVLGGSTDAQFIGLERLRALAGEILQLREVLEDLACLGNEHARKKIGRLQRILDEMTPSVTMIGQVKAGKSSLVNAMIGRPDFLPADVNPWTSVVTSLMLNVPRGEGEPAASFQLFSEDEWDNLVEGGGRLGELSRRAQADAELEKVHAQIAEMRERSRQRLGRKFELLLGQRHDYAQVSEDLIQRYVCLGDELEMGESGADAQGRFADITKSAEIHLDAPRLPLPLCIRDTPGVNDTFLVREQITINALRGSRLCVVVLSAHQALTTTDMAMIRMISALKSREVVIFVNRIDELPDPANQIAEIEASVTETLAKHNGPKDAQVLFGSAYWANQVVRGAVKSMTPESARSLDVLAEGLLGEAAHTITAEETAWHLSGLPDLWEALGERISAGIAADTMHSIRAQAMNLASGLALSSSVVDVRLNGDRPQRMSRAELSQRLQLLEDKAKIDLNQALDRLAQDFSERIDRSHHRFLDRALERLLQHLESGAEDKSWTYSADGLRLLLRSAFTVLATKYRKVCGGVYAAAAADLAGVYRKAFDVDAEGFAIEPPQVPDVPAPVSLGTTIALDLNTSWWRGWWQRVRGIRSQADTYLKLIAAETAPLLEQLEEGLVSEMRSAAMRRLETLFSEQTSQLLDVFDQSEVRAEDIEALFGVPDAKEREFLLSMIVEELQLSGDGEEEASR